MAFLFITDRKQNMKFIIFFLVVSSFLLGCGGRLTKMMTGLPPDVFVHVDDDFDPTRARKIYLVIVDERSPLRKNNLSQMSTQTIEYNNEVAFKVSTVVSDVLNKKGYSTLIAETNMEGGGKKAGANDFRELSSFALTVDAELVLKVVLNTFTRIDNAKDDQKELYLTYTYSVECFAIGAVSRKIGWKASAQGKIKSWFTPDGLNVLSDVISGVLEKFPEKGKEL